MEFVIDRTLQDVAQGTHKGYLNATDLIRIENNIRDISALFNISYTPVLWSMDTIIYEYMFDNILESLETIKNKFDVNQGEIPSMPLNHFEQFNKLELFLMNTYNIYNRNLESAYYCDDIYCNTIGLL